MSPHFKGSVRWAPLWNALSLEDVPNGDGTLHTTSVTAYRIKDLGLSLLPHVFVMGDVGNEYNEKAIEILKTKQCGHTSGDVTREYKKVGFARGATFRATRRMFLKDRKICVERGDDESAVGSGSSVEEPVAGAATTAATAATAA